MTTAIDEIVITEPGVYDMPDRVYHADPVPGGSLSSSGAKLLLPPSVPAKFQHWREHGSAPKAEFNFGHAAHKHVLGAGAPLVVVDADNWRTKAAREARDDAYAAGQVPLLAADHDRVIAMAAALLEHPTAAALFSNGRPEQSAFWIDPATDVWLRARFDWLRDPAPGRRLIIPDYKTTPSADDDHIQRAIYNFGYHRQGAWYIDTAIHLDLGEPDTAFVLVFQEIDPPYLVRVVQLDPTALRIGRQLNRQAIDTYRRCVDSGEWPGYGTDIELVPLPAWAEARHTSKEIW